jgi:protein involved in polysaccharide export with SLBB domain
MKTRLAAALVSLLVLACQSTRTPTGPVVIVEGAVAHPGAQTWHEDVTALEAVLRSAPTTEARLAAVELVRAGNPPLRIVLDLERMRISGDSTANVHVQPGDVLHVPAR